MSPSSSKPPYRFAETSLVKFLARRIDQLKPNLTQREIAHRLGYTCVNIVSMMKTGAARVPFEKIPRLAEILEADPAHLLRLGFAQYWPEFAVALTVLPAPVTKHEAAILSLIRDVTDNADPELTAEQEAALVRILSPKRERASRAIPG